MRMTSGEKMIWAAAFVAEYRSGVLGVGSFERRCEPYVAARYARQAACEAVQAARGAVDSSPDSCQEHQARLCEMVRVPQARPVGKAKRRRSR